MLLQNCTMYLILYLSAFINDEKVAESYVTKLVLRKTGIL